MMELNILTHQGIILHSVFSEQSHCRRSTMELMAAFPRDYRFGGVLFDYPSLVLAIIVAYLVFVLKIGPEFMRNRKPYNLRMVARIYNVFQVMVLHN